VSVFANDPKHHHHHHYDDDCKAIHLSEMPRRNIFGGRENV